MLCYPMIQDAVLHYGTPNDKDKRESVFYYIMTFASLACWWCLYLKNITTLTTMRKLFLISGRNSYDPVVKELVICPTCENELPMSVMDQIRLILPSKPELADWIISSDIYKPEK